MGLSSFTYQIEIKHYYYFLITKMDNSELLKQIVNITEPKGSFSIVVSDNTTRFKTWFKPQIQLDKKKDYEIALINLETNYSFPNIDRSNNFILLMHSVQPHHGLT